MKFSITIKGIRKEVDVEPIDEKKLRVRIDGEDYEVAVEGFEALFATWKPHSRFAYELEHDIPPLETKPKEGFVESTLEVETVPREAKDEVQTVEKVPVRETLTKPESLAILEVKSPLPGVISLIEVKEGRKVKRGDVLLYIESMKMLNEIVSPRDGVVSRVMKSAGEQVNVGDPLVELIPAGE
ncbi:MAG: biotin/lipoyl-binding protein [Candidatus Methanomethyliaceae archaeon]|nr:biotin/lipoyl-binding protein [Candidatus Methanomethyliaceae archaeon]